MNILTPQEVNNEKLKTDTERRSRMLALHEEETTLIKNINTLRETEKTEKERIAKEHAADEERRQARIRELTSEVEGLEARRREAEKPVKDAWKEVEHEKYKIKCSIDELAQREINVRGREVAVTEREAEIPKSEQRIRDAEQAASEMMKKAESQASGVELSVEKLRKDTEAFHSEVEQKNAIISEREQNVKMAEAANEKVKNGLAAQRDELSKKERQLADGYATLARATERLNKQKNG